MCFLQFIIEEAGRDQHLYCCEAVCRSRSIMSLVGTFPSFSAFLHIHNPNFPHPEISVTVHT